MKKVLSIVLSIVMVLCMMPAMAFAGTADFTDAADIQHDVAVDTLVALGIHEGYPDGSYQPAKVVTRAEMAKTIATVLNGGEAPVLSTTTVSYGDTQGHWAAGYIEYCTSLGIVEGVGAGQFAPDAPVTAEAAAKMILVAQGYNAVVEGMTGAQWASNTNVLANQEGYYAEMKDIDTAAGCSREHVAQMICNALDAKVINKSNSVNKETGVVTTVYTPAEKTTVAIKYLGLDTIEDVTITKVTYDKKTGYTYTLTDADAKTSTVSTTADYTDLFQMHVKVLYKVVNSKVVVYGMFADECEVAYEGVYGDIGTAADDKVKIDGVEYKIDTTLKNVLPEYAEYGQGGEEKVVDYSNIKVIDCEADGDIDAVVYTPVSVAEVGYVGKTQVTYGKVTKKIDEEVLVYDGIAKGDFVSVTTDIVAKKPVLTKLETLENVTVSSTKGETAIIDGVSYGNTDKLVTAGSNGIDVGILNGYIVIADKVDTTVDYSKYAVVTANKEINDYTKTYKAMLLGIDGAETEVEITADDYDQFVGALVTYKVVDGKYDLTAAPTSKTDTAFEDVFTAAKLDPAATDKAADINDVAIADDAVVFVKTVDAKDKTKITYSVITGKELAAKSSADVANAYVELSQATGYSAVTLAYVGDVKVEASSYAYVLDDLVYNKDKDGVVTYDAVLSTGNFVIEDVTVTGVEKGAVVSYKVGTNGKITEITPVTTEAAVKAYDGTKISFDGKTSYKFADNATIIYVDSKAQTVADGGTVVLADKDADSNYVENVIYKLDAKSEKVELLVVDINNVWTTLA